MKVKVEKGYTRTLVRDVETDVPQMVIRSIEDAVIEKALAALAVEVGNVEVKFDTSDDDEQRRLLDAEAEELVLLHMAEDEMFKSRGR